MRHFKELTTASDLIAVEDSTGIRVIYITSKLRALKQYFKTSAQWCG